MEDRLEVIFAHRNKAYGAYQLRRSYGPNLGRALGIGLGIIFLAIFLPRWLAARVWEKAEPPREVVAVVTEVNLEKPLTPPPPPEQPAPPARPTQAFKPPVVLSDDQVPEEPSKAAIDELQHNPADIGATTTAGDPNALPQLTDPGPDLGAIDNGPAVTKPETTFELFDVNVPPRFGSGEQELLQYLAENIRYPALARENNIQGTVVLAFVVDKDGQVRDVTVVKDIGAGCGKEALRVLNEMPAWRPGEAAGQAVRVRFTLPVRFKLQ